jgi:hypothetical protein
MEEPPKWADQSPFLTLASGRGEAAGAPGFDPGTAAASQRDHRAYYNTLLIEPVPNALLRARGGAEAPRLNGRSGAA